MVIRPYRDSDKEDVRFICLNSEGPCTMSERDCYYILTTYCDYFVEQEGRNCFVAVDGNDKAVGYIICAENYDNYKRVFDSEYVTRFGESDTDERTGALHSADLQAKYKNDYPAHLHIDVLPEYQRAGLGHRLVDTLIAHLRAKGIGGVMLTAGEDNNVGRSFYRKYGFTELEVAHGDAAYGIKIL